jgi:pimeloyl-ACP methyl ester carboxylesterase
VTVAAPFDIEHRFAGEVRRVHGERWSGSRSGRPCIALHSGPGFGAATLRAGAEQLAAVVDLVLVDLPGSGASSRHPGSAYPIEGYIADVLAVRGTLGALPPLLLGHGWGAILAVEVALAQPDAVAGVAMLNPLRVLNAAGQDTAAQQRQVERVDATLLPRFTSAVLPTLQQAMQGLAPWDEVDANPWWPQMWATQWAGAPTPAWQATLRGHRPGMEAYFAHKGQAMFDSESRWARYDLAARLPALRCPAGVLASSHDANYVALPHIHLEPLRQALPELHVELIDDAGHFLVAEAPERVAAFLQRHWAATA